MLPNSPLGFFLLLIVCTGHAHHSFLQLNLKEPDPGPRDWLPPMGAHQGAQASLPSGLWKSEALGATLQHGVRVQQDTGSWRE